MRPVDDGRPAAEEAVGPARRWAFTAGVVAAGVAVGATELLAGAVAAVPSLVAAVGDVVIDGSPRPVVEWGIRTFGQQNKAVLVMATVAVTITSGGVVGVASRRRPWVRWLAFTGFGAMGAMAAARDPATVPALAAVVTAASVAAGLAVLSLLLDATPRDASHGVPAPVAPGGTRRTFLALSGAFAVLAVASAAAGRSLLRGSKAAAARAAVMLPPPLRSLPRPPPDTALDIEGLSPLFTPNERFYRVDTALAVPDVDLEAWRLDITGLVDRPLSLSYDDLLALPLVEADISLTCVSNPVGGPLVGTARWLGVPLADLLERAGTRPSVTQVVGRSVDGFTAGFQVPSGAAGGSALVALGMNGEPLPLVHGFPARLVVTGLYGYVSATKWLREIELTTLDAFDAYWVRRGWAKTAPVKTQSRIDVPRAGDRLRPGPTMIAGVAWATGRGISRVEVRVDDEPWADARLAVPLGDDTWRQWVVDWDATPGLHTLRVRATDGTGTTQTAEDREPFPDGATGYHTILVTVEDR